MPEAGTCGRLRTVVGHGLRGLPQTVERRDLGLKLASPKPKRPLSAHWSACSPRPARPPRLAVSYRCLATPEGHGSRGADAGRFPLRLPSALIESQQGPPISLKGTRSGVRSSLFFVASCGS